MSSKVTDDEPWRKPAWVARTRLIIDSFRRWVGRDLIAPAVNDESLSRALFEAPFVVVSHGTEADPVLNYANRTAIRLWETDLATLLTTPSRKTAEPMHRDERAQMLERTSRDGFIDDYAGVRISANGRRFRIEQAIVWNVVDEKGDPVGQAATFDHWTFIEP